MLHPWLKKYPIKPNSKYLILGTHPPMPYSGNLRFFYGNMSEFWRFLDLVFPGNRLYSNGCPNLKDLLFFLNRNKISITDIIYRTSSQKFSTDAEIGKINNDDLNPFFIKWLRNSEVEVIYFTSLGGRNSAKSLFKKWYRKEFKKASKITDNHINAIRLYDRDIKLIDLFSPSPTARRSSSRVKEFIKWQTYQKIDNDYDSFRIYWYKKYLPKISF
jgi:G:T/U-mismatch repair DNA glycosylase